MRVGYTFDITFEFDDPDVENLEAWNSAVSESCREFGDELNAFLNKHPMVKACSMTERTTK